MAPKTSAAATPARLTGTGTMAHVVRATDWSTTPLGRIEGWSERLKTAVDICLQSALPNFVWWGRDLIQIYNDAAIGLLGVKHPHALGQAARDTWAEQWPTMGLLVDDIMATGKSIQWDDVWVRPDQAPGPDNACFAFNMGALQSNDGEFEGLIVTAIENTAQTRTEADLQEDEFMALLAHELRNPLAPIRMTVGILRAREGSDPLLIKCRQVIDRQSVLMTRLLEDLLDVSRVSHGKLVLQPARISFKSVLDAAIETSRPIMDQHGHELIVDAPKLDFVIDADGARLTQVFANLLNNAAKYSPRGKTIDVVVRQQENNLVVRVRDQGIGIAPEMLGRIFDLFVQCENARDHASGGLGIGLSLAMRLVDMHNGAIHASSAGLGQGSEFTVTLPLVSAPPAHADVGLLLTDVSLPYRKILIADDSVDAADMIALLLDAPGCEIRTVYGGEAAVREVERFHPDLILLDLEMPGVDGYESCRRIRSTSWGAQTVLVALSGWGQNDARSVLAGFDLHLMKPIDPDNLVQALRDIRPV